jgi:hypothetical protein
MLPSATTERRSDGTLLWSVISLLTGAFLSHAVSKIFDGGEALLNASLSAVALILAAVLAFTTFVHGRADGKRLDALISELELIRSRVGEPAELTIETFAKSTGEYYRRLERLIDRLGRGDEVLVLSYHFRPATEGQARNPVHADARQAYLDTLLRKAREGVTYRRILCFEEIDGDLRVRPELLSEHTRNHCISMIDLAAELETGAVAIKKARALVTADILIINHETGAISMETYAEAERTYTAGALIVHDPPNGRIVDQLRAWWEGADAKSGVVRKEELQPKPAATPATLT